MQKVLPALVVVFKGGLHVLVVNRFIDGDEHGGRIGCFPAGSQLVQRIAELHPSRLGLGGNREFHHQGGEGFRRRFRPVFRACGPARPEFLRHAGADAGQEHDHAAEGQLVPRIDDEAHEGHHVLDVRLLEEPDTAGDAEGYFTARQFHLQFHAVEVRPVEHGYFIGVRTFFNKVPDALGNEFGLHPVIIERHEGGRHFPGGTHGTQAFFNLHLVGGNGRIGKFQDFRHAAVVGFYLEGFRRRVARREAEDVLHVRAAPGIDALGIVSHDHELAVLPGQHVDEAALEVVGILVFVHQDVVEARAVQGAQVLLFLEEAHDVEQQVVKVHAVGFLLAEDVLFMHVQNGVQMVGEVGIGVFQRFLNAGAFIVRQAEKG